MTDTKPLRKVPRSLQRSWMIRHLKMEQDGKCPLCGKEIDITIKGEGVVDHDHDTGEIRGVLHRSCNAAEGKISNAAARWGAKSSSYADIIVYLESVVAYLKRPGTGFMYHSHQTPEEKQSATKARQREQRARRKAVLAMRATKQE